MYVHQIKGAFKFRLGALSSAVIALSFVAQGCGPIRSHSTIARAHIAIEAAEGARADRLAVFEYESAKLYLRKAKLEEGLSAFKSAIEFARAAQNYADSARARAIKNAQARPLTPTERRRMMMQQDRTKIMQQSPIKNTQPTQATPSVTPTMPSMPSMPSMPKPSSNPNQTGGR